MAIRPSVAYPGQTDTGDLASYPHGKAQNQLVAGDGVGTPLEARWLNDLWGFQQALLAAGGIASPSGQPDRVGASQYLEAIQALIADRADPLDTRVTAIEDALAAEGTFTRVLPLPGMAFTTVGATGSWERKYTASDDYEFVGFSGSRLRLDLSGFVGPGDTVTKLEAVVDPGFASMGSDRMSVALYVRGFAPNAFGRRTVLVSSKFADETADEQTIALDPLSFIVGGGGAYIEIKASASTPPGGDNLYAVRITTQRTGL